MIYTHVVRDLRPPVASPLDRLLAGEAEAASRGQVSVGRTA